MKRILILIAAIVFIMAANVARAQSQLPPQNTNNQFFMVSGCSSFTPNTPYPPVGAVCFDTGTGQTFYWSGSAFVAPTLQAANGGTIGGCLWTATLSSGIGTSTGIPCLAACKNVGITTVTAALGGGSPTTLATPTSGVNNVVCAQPAAAATVVKCVSSNGSGAQIVQGNCVN